jgi:type II secretion system protein G
VQQRLRQRLRAARANEGGFTLIELLIVIVILGILAGVVVFSVNFVQERGVKAACQTDVKNVQTAVEAYKAQTGNYPANIAALTPNYIKSTPDGTRYYIQYDGAGNVTADCVNPTPAPSPSATP